MMVMASWLWNDGIGMLVMVFTAQLHPVILLLRLLSLALVGLGQQDASVLKHRKR
jgi:hypothetical protein